MKYLASGCKTRDKWRCAAASTSCEQFYRSTSHTERLGACPVVYRIGLLPQDPSELKACLWMAYAEGAVSFVLLG